MKLHNNMKNTPWTKEQTIVAFNLYCKIPFQKASSTNPDIVRIAEIIGRGPNSVKMKIGNFGSFDPELKKRGIVGLTNASKLDKTVWDEFHHNWESLVFESEKLIAQFSNKKIKETVTIEEPDLLQGKGKEKERLVKIRVNQSFFRQTILVAYNNTCCITGIKIPELLIASHIKPWKISDDKTEKLNPRNGLCLNALHDKAFDKGLITVLPDHHILISRKVFDCFDDKIIKHWFKEIDGNKIRIPERFVPKRSFLIYHNERIFEK